MKAYELRYSKQAVKFLLKQPKNQQERLYRAIQKLPNEGDIKAMAGRSNIFRLRVGDYRVIYEVADKVKIIYILTVGNRGDAYK